MFVNERRIPTAFPGRDVYPTHTSAHISDMRDQSTPKFKTGKARAGQESTQGRVKSESVWTPPCFLGFVAWLVQQIEPQHRSSFRSQKKG